MISGVATLNETPETATSQEVTFVLPEHPSLTKAPKNLKNIGHEKSRPSLPETLEESFTFILPTSTLETKNSSDFDQEGKEDVFSFHL